MAETTAPDPVDTAGAAATDSSKARFAKEVAKYPDEQKQSAVMALLAIVQQEQGFVSKEAELEVAGYLGMAPIAVHEVRELRVPLGTRVARHPPEAPFEQGPRALPADSARVDGGQAMV